MRLISYAMWGLVVLALFTSGPSFASTLTVDDIIASGIVPAQLSPAAKPVPQAPDKEKDPVQQALNAREDRQMDRDERRSARDTKGVETYTDRIGWTTSDGFSVMENYVARLKRVCEERLPGRIDKIAGGKKGILLIIPAKTKKSFFLAQENTAQFLRAIVQDLRTMPEPVLLQVTVNYRGVPIIAAYQQEGEIKVEFLK